MGSSGTIFGASWAVLGCLGAVLGRLWSLLGCPGPSWDRLGSILGRLGKVFGVLGRLGTLLDSPEAGLGPSWSPPDALVANCVVVVVGRGGEGSQGVPGVGRVGVGVVVVVVWSGGLQGAWGSPGRGLCAVLGRRGRAFTDVHFSLTKLMILNVPGPSRGVQEGFRRRPGGVLGLLGGRLVKGPG